MDIHVHCGQNENIIKVLGKSIEVTFTLVAQFLTPDQQSLVCFLYIVLLLKW